MSVQATVSVRWNTLGTVEDSNGNLPVGSIAQLIWAGADNVIDPFDFNNPLLATNDDIILAPHTNSVPGFLTPGTTTAMGENFGQGSDGFVGGFVYVRVFTSNAPMVGTEYGEVFFATPLADQDPTGPGAQVFDISGGVGNTFVLNNTVVPEPSSMALLALGAGWLVSRKRRV